MVLSVGDPVPAVQATNQDGDTVELAFDSATVVYFYPRDNTPGCTTEACQFDAELETYEEAGVRVYGVSTDTVESHAAFSAEHALGFDLLADPNGEIADAFGVSVDQDRAARTTFVLADGRVKAVYSDVRPDGHARTVLRDMLESGLVEIDW